MMQTSEDVELCFPTINISCKKTIHNQATIIYTLLSSITALTVVLNLLVIISISHFRQLQTTTNLLLLSLAVSDFLVGFLQMPGEILLFRGCWILGDIGCVVNYFLASLVISVSVGNMVLISIDRYVAICDPMSYPTKVTVKRVQLCIFLCWIFSAVHASWILRDLLKQPDRFNSCYGECAVLISYAEGVVDLIVSFFGPITVIILLYMRVFAVAVSQARTIRPHIATVSKRFSGTVTVLKSEIKAATVLGIVVITFLFCFTPYFYFTVAADYSVIGASTAGAQIWVLYFNSCLNPLIYVFFYPWFRKSVKQIVTLKILQPQSCEASM